MTTPVTAAGCAAPDQAAPLPLSVDLEKETVITGIVQAEVGDPVPGAYVRLLDRSGEFTAEVVTSPAGDFRFYAAPGSWTVRALSRAGNGEASGKVELGINQLDIVLV